MNALSAQLPVYDSGKPNFKKISDTFCINSDSLAKIMDVSTATIKRPPTIATFKKSQPLLYVLNMLWKLLDGNSEEISRWLHEPRIQWHGLTPLNLMEMGRIDAIKELLESEINGYGEYMGG